MSFKVLFELRKRMYVTEAVWKRIPNGRSSKMKGAFTGRLFIHIYGEYVGNGWEQLGRVGLYQICILDRNKSLLYAYKSFCACSLAVSRCIDMAEKDGS